MNERWEILDGNEAAARVAYAVSEVISIYPITPASSMAEHADDWSAAGKPNLWGKVPDVIEMQSEAGAAGAMHGALQKGALATTFTASQGLLLMIPNMFKIAGELTPAVIHVAARTIATHALSIFGDHSDVMHARATGWAMLSGASVQEAHDFALVSHAATLRARIPFIHFFDGFRTSHEVNKIATLSAEQIRALVREEDVLAFRGRGMTPDAPSIRGTAQNPDGFFQAREAANPFHDAIPGIVEAVFAELEAQTGRRYGLMDYHGAPDADRVIVVMGSAGGAIAETVDALNADGEKVGMIQVRLFNPFPADRLIAALPRTVRAIAVLDRTKEPGSVGEPLYQAVVAAVSERMDDEQPPFAATPRILGGRYGLSSKEVTPGMIRPIFEELRATKPKRHFTVGIYDDVTHLSLPIDSAFRTPRPAGEVQALFFGLGSDGTVGANKSSVKIIGEGTPLFAQGYFVYDSKKSHGTTVSHLRFGPEPIRSAYLIEGADFIACHQFPLLEKTHILEYAKPGSTFLLNSPYPPSEVWDHLPGEVQRQLVEKRIALWVIDAFAVAAEVGMGNRINTIMQPCFFALSGVLPAEDAIARIKQNVEKTYAKRGQAIVDRNFAAIDASLARMVQVPLGSPSDRTLPALVPPTAPDFVKSVTAALMAGDGDLLPVSAFPADGVFPPGTTRYEKRAIAQEMPSWDPSICIDCGKCAIVCPHAAIRMKVYPEAALQGAPATFLSKEFKSRELADHRLTIQVAPDDCTGCGVCVDVCPAKDKTELRHKAIDMTPAAPRRTAERPNWDFFQAIAPLDRTLLPHDTVKGSQVLEPLFEFSLACSGCGETPYLKLVSQLFGDRMIVANATGCSSIYGANLPTTPWTVNGQGRGPAWANSLFEDNAEFGLGMRLALDAQTDTARVLLERLAGEVGEALVREILDAPQATETEIEAQRVRVEQLRARLAGVTGERAADAKHLLSLAGDLVKRGIWIVGGDGWAYDIGFGGLDHVLGSGRNVNILVLDTEVYSNTGGQASKSTPRAAVAKFAAAGKSRAKKDLGAIARAYGDVFVAQVSMGANDAQTAKALLEADAWPGPSLVIAYSTCIAHGIDMSKSMSHQKDAVRSGYWPLYRFHPSDVGDGQPFKLDSTTPSIPVADFIASEARFGVLARTNPTRAAELAELVQADVNERWHYYEQLSSMHRSVPHITQEPGGGPGGGDGAPGGGPGGERRRRGMSVDLTTRYLGLQLRSPIVASPNPLNRKLESAKRIAEAGAGAIVLPSLFEEEILHEELDLTRSLEAGSEQFAEALDYFPTIHDEIGAGERYLDLIRTMKAHLDVPVIASLNAVTAGGWVRYARLIQEAGADALELNLYRIPADPRLTAGEIEGADLDLVEAVRLAVSIPVAVKLSPYYTAMARFAAQVVERGANGLVLFNRFYQPDFDLDSFDVVPRLELSTSSELRLPLRWIAILRPQLDGDVSLAATSGIHRGTDAVKALMAGADVAMTASAILHEGPRQVGIIERELRAWMEEHDYASVVQLRGSATHASVADPSAFERANYISTLHSWSTPDL